MADLITRINNLATRIATECKALRAERVAANGDLAALTTTTKASLVAAVNELDSELASLAASVGAQIADSSTGSATTWSSTKIALEIQAAKTALTNGAATALDTLSELAVAIGNDANFAATMTAALGNRLRVDAAQTLTAGQKTQACTNLGVGEPDTDFAATFTAGLI